MSNSDPKSSKSGEHLDSSALRAVTNAPIRRLSSLEFLGFLTREDKDAVYIADSQGTWVIQRDDLLSVEDWQAEGFPQSMTDMGRPVRVGVRLGAIIQEIRPWRVEEGPREVDPGITKTVQKIFTLGGAPPPVSDRTILGDAQLAELEQAFARQIGWGSDLRGALRSSRSGTISMYLGGGVRDHD